MIDSIVLEEMLIPNHNITVKTTPTTNPNDRESTKAVKLDFYDNDKKIGIAYISAIDTNNGFIYNLEVYKKYRGNGYANDIMNYILKNYKARSLSVLKTNTIAINLYKKFGFKVTQSYKWGKQDLYYMELK